MVSKAVAIRGKTRTRTIVVRSGARKKSGFTVPVAVLAGLTPMAMDMIGSYKETHDIRTPFEHMSMCITGYNPADNSMNPGFAIRKFYVPMALGMLTHKLAGKMGINRALARAGVPFIRI